jgi:hypothetical protein
MSPNFEVAIQLQKFKFTKQNGAPYDSVATPSAPNAPYKEHVTADRTVRFIERNFCTVT